MTASLDDLRRVPLFSGMTDRTAQAVADLAREVDFENGTAVVTEGEPGDAFYLVLDGIIRVSQGGTPVRDLGAGDFIGEIALIDGRPRTATGVAVGPLHALVIERAAFNELMERHPAIRLGILMALTERIRRDEREAVA